MHKVSYDGIILPDTCVGYHQWLEWGIGIIGLSNACEPAYANEIKAFQAQFLPAELEYHYS